jgi:hypothetical protein
MEVQDISIFTEKSLLKKGDPTGVTEGVEATLFYVVTLNSGPYCT